MNEPKINAIKADSFKEAYDVAPEEFKEQIEKLALGYYSAEIEKLIQSFNPKDTAFIINALRLELIALECAFQRNIIWLTRCCRKKHCRS